MTREKKLITNTIIYSIGTLGSKVLVFLLIPIYTKYLRQDDLGYYDIIISTINLVLPFLSLEIFESCYRYLLDNKYINNKKDIITNSLFIMLRNLLIFNLIFLALKNIGIINFRYNLEIMILINVTILFNSIQQIVRGLKLNKLYSLIGVINTVITISSNIICVIILKLGIKSLLISSIVSNLVCIIVMIFKGEIFKYISINFINKEIRKRLLIYSLPLIPNTISWWIMNLSDRYIINIFLGSEANGIYAIANKLPAILMMVNSVFYLAWQESAILEIDSSDNKTYYNNMFLNYFKLQFSSMFILMAITPIIFNILVDKSYIDSYNFIPFLYIGVVLYSLSSFLGVIYDAKKETHKSFITSSIGAIVNLYINFILINKIGIQSASFSTMLGFFTMFILRYIDIKKYTKLKIRLKLIVPIVFILIVSIKLYYYNSISMIICKIIISMILFIRLNVNLINNIINKKYKTSRSVLKEL